MAHNLKNSAAPGRRVTTGDAETISTPALTSNAAARTVTAFSCLATTDNVTIYKPAIDPVLRLPEVLEIVPIGRTKLLQMVKDGAFPAPLHLTARIRGWRLSAIHQFLNSVEGK